MSTSFPPIPGLTPPRLHETALKTGMKGGNSKVKRMRGMLRSSRQEEAMAVLARVPGRRGFCEWSTVFGERTATMHDKGVERRTYVETNHIPRVLICISHTRSHRPPAQHSKAKHTTKLTLATVGYVAPHSCNHRNSMPQYLALPLPLHLTLMLIVPPHAQAIYPQQTVRIVLLRPSQRLRRAL